VKVVAGNKLKQANGERFYYDRRDNVVMRESDRKSTSYEYDSFDQLVEISLNGRKWQADYDALGRRTRKHWAGQTTEYYWDHDRLLGEVRGDSSVRVYVYADDRALVPFMYVDYVSLDAETDDGNVKYLFTNHLGVPERVEDDSGRTIWQGEVSPYGMMRIGLGRLDEVNLRFPGHYYDGETGLHYNRFRSYDPSLGCYLQCDPLGIAGGYNLYAYVSNPLTGVDILGLTTAGHHDQTKKQDDQTNLLEGKSKANGSSMPNRREVIGSPHPKEGEALVGSSQKQMREAAAKLIADANIDINDPKKRHPLWFGWLAPLECSRRSWR
jgi:RHS repeat-associated protein